jgi:hypothetical protein
MKVLIAALFLAAGWLCPCAEAQQKAPLVPPPTKSSRPAGTLTDADFAPEDIKPPAQASKYDALLSEPSKYDALLDEFDPPTAEAARADAERRQSLVVWRYVGLALVPLAFIGISAWGASILIKSGRIGRLLSALRAVPERLLTARAVLVVACLLLMASWAYPPGFERGSGNGWFFLFDTDSEMKVDFPRLILLDAIIAAGAGMVAWSVSRSSSTRGTVVRLAYYSMVAAPVLAVTGGAVLLCGWVFPQAEAWANQPRKQPPVTLTLTDADFEVVAAPAASPFDPKTATFDPDAFLAETPKAAAPIDPAVVVKSVLKMTKDVDVQLAYGKMKLPVGTPVKFVSREGNVVKVSYLNTILTLPVNSTDLDVPVAAPRDPPPSVRPTP